MISAEQQRLLINGQQKISANHLERLACVYIRQSTREQVLRHRGSQQNQYQLVERAEGLGWVKERVQVIDCDLGLSGRESSNRSGFQELVAAVSLGHVGIIFGYEVSRLARNNSDWYHLLDLAAIFNTLIADYDGIYDPRLYNDRLLLGLKGTMSEAELHLIRLRMEAGRMRQIEQGQYRQQLPTGLVRLADGTVVKEPDEQVRHMIEWVLSKFETLGSCRQVMLDLRRSEVLLPRQQTNGPQVGEIVWKQPTYSAVYAIVTNPAYAGAFAYGRTQVDPTRRQPGRKDSGIVRKAMDEWVHLAKDVYPAYISWDQFQANQIRLQQNSTQFQEQIKQAQGKARRGQALLQGLAICGCCGHRLQVSYKPVHRYICKELAHELGEPMCVSLHGPQIDQVVIEAFFAAIEPVQLDVLDAVLAEQATEQAQVQQQWQERLKRAAYEVGLAQRRYNQVDPDNRLVATELERQWEEKLQQQQQTQEAYERFQHTSTAPTIAPELRTQFRQLSATLPDLWHSGQLTNTHKKELLRSLITQVILKRATGNTVEARIVWVSGHYSVVYAQPPVYRTRRLANYDQLVARIETLWPHQNDDQIAAQLTQEGFRSPRALVLTANTVQRLRLAHGWKRPRAQPPYRSGAIPGYLSVTDLAQQLGVHPSWLYRRIRTQQIDPTYLRPHPSHKAIMIRDDPHLIVQLQQELSK